MTKSQQTVLISGARAPVALHLGCLFKAEGWRVFYTDSFYKPITSSAFGVQNYIRLAPPRSHFKTFARQLTRLVNKEKIDLIIPTSEEIFYVTKAADKNGFSKLLFAPNFDVLKAAHNKWTFSQTVSNLSITTPNSELIITKKELLAAQTKGKIFKPIWSRFGSQVLFEPNAGQINKTHPTKACPWISQDLIKGSEYCLYAICQHGKLVALSAYKPTWRAGLGAGIYFLPIKSRALEVFVQEFAAATHWHGQVSFDFIQDKNLKFHVLECNPRAVSGLHFFTPSDHLTHAFTTGGKQITPAFQTPLCSKTAMWVYALPRAILRGKVNTWWYDLTHSTDILKHTGARNLIRAQGIFLGEIALRALKTRSSLITASTFDIEWNGEDIS